MDHTGWPLGMWPSKVPHVSDDDTLVAWSKSPAFQLIRHKQGGGCAPGFIAAGFLWPSLASQQDVTR